VYIYVDSAIRPESAVETPILRVEGFDSFYRQEYRRAVALVYSLTGSWVTAEDVVQEGMLSAHKNWAKISGYDDPRAWLRRVLANRVTSYHRSRAAEWRAARRMESLEAAGGPVPELEPDDAQVWQAVRRLPRRQAQVIALHYVNELSLDEIATALGCSPGTVKSHLHRARQRLSRRLAAPYREAR
jgi:RNA polymerase sigma-70 factor (ECF subfamily)